MYLIYSVKEHAFNWSTSLEYFVSHMLAPIIMCCANYCGIIESFSHKMFLIIFSILVIHLLSQTTSQIDWRTVRIEMFLYCLFSILLIGFINFSAGILISYVTVPFLLLGSYYPSLRKQKTKLEKFFTFLSIAVLLLYAFGLFSIKDWLLSFLSSSDFEIMHYGIICIIAPTYILSWRISLQSLFY